MKCPEGLKSCALCSRRPNWDDDRFEMKTFAIDDDRFEMKTFAIPSGMSADEWWGLFAPLLRAPPTSRVTPRKPMNCIVCNEQNAYVEPNQPNGTYKCYSCRTRP